MQIQLGAAAVEFLAGDRLAGRYVFGDEFKPHVHPLNTPTGRTVSLASPHDHKHHKGLMYALRVRDVNFWEEVPTLPGEVPGIERHERFESLTASGAVVGFVEELTWLADDGGLVTFRERRSLSCRELPNDRGYEWTWSSELEAQRDIDLVMSQWSVTGSTGRPVNYHGLGIRFSRDFGCTGGNALFLDGVASQFADGLGRTPSAAEFRGTLDGFWPARHAGVRIQQDQGHGLFVMETPFAFMSLGPSNLAPISLRKGQRLPARYVVSVFDLPIA